MTGRHITIGVSRNDRTGPIIDGLCSAGAGVAKVDCLSHEKLFELAFDEQRYDVTELSLSNFIMMSMAGRCGYVGLPVFTSRMFRHSAIYIRKDRGISGPADLKGKVIGLREFSNTATLTAKGMLSDEYGIQQNEIRWRFGPVNPGESIPILRRIPEAIDVAALPPGDCLSNLLTSGELDALISYSPPACFLDGHPEVGRLFDGYQAEEAAYFSRSGIFPIMHLLGIRRSLAHDADLCLQLCSGFDRARRRSMAALQRLDALPVMLPWLDRFVEQARRVLGPDYWPYGLARNRAPLNAAARWLWEQNLVDQAPEIERLFAHSTLAWEPEDDFSSARFTNSN